jgi:hypothetical protein
MNANVMKMKHKIFSSLAIICVLGFTSCKKNFLGQVPDDKLSIEDVFKGRVTTEKFLANVYNYLPTDVNLSLDSPWEGLSDEMDVTYNDYATFSMNLGNWDRNRDSYNFWAQNYKGIRSASYFLQHADDNKVIEPDVLKKYKAEARGLRAIFYFMIMRQYGPMVILPETGIAPDASLESMALPRSSFDECVDYVTSEMDKAITDLPVAQASTTDYGRLNQAMLQAFKSRLLLYAASPLFNGNTDYATFKNKDGKQLISQQYDVNKWKRAADAAKAVIDHPEYRLYKELDGSGKIKPYESCKNVFLQDWNPEVIMARVSDMYMFDKAGSPYKAGGWSAWGPTQQAVDAYFMNNGRPIDDPASGYNEVGFTNSSTSYYDAGTSNMYINREARFYVAITFNGSKWINTAGGSNNQPITVQMYNGGNSGKYNGRNWSRTGYCMRKQVHPSSFVTSPEKIQQRTEILIRLAEIYLNYAESLNEAEPGNSDILKYLNMIRERAGVPQYGAGADALPVPSGQAATREAIHKERRVELAFESHRFFDTRRWKIAAQTDGGPFYGMDIEANNTAAFTKRTVFETRVFLQKNYLWNILQSELDKDKNLVENPGW